MRQPFLPITNRAFCQWDGRHLGVIPIVHLGGALHILQAFTIMSILIKSTIHNSFREFVMYYLRFGIITYTCSVLVIHIFARQFTLNYRNNDNKTFYIKELQQQVAIAEHKINSRLFFLTFIYLNPFLTPIFDSKQEFLPPNRLKVLHMSYYSFVE